LQSPEEAVTRKKIERTFNTLKKKVNLNHVQIFGLHRTANTIRRGCKFQSKVYAEMEIISTWEKNHKN